jgi:hypothetical protein
MVPRRSPATALTRRNRRIVFEVFCIWYGLVCTIFALCEDSRQTPPYRYKKDLEARIYCTTGLIL